MNISAPFIHRPIATALLMVGLLVGGLVSYPLLPVAALPNVNYPTLQVTAQLPGADPQTMASSVATPLELQFGEIPGLAQMTSASALGYTQITLQFDLNRQIDGTVSDTLSAINAATPYLPVGMPYPPTIRKVNPADTPILVLGLTSDTLPLTTVDAYAENILLQKISQISGVGLVGIGGQQKPAVRVQLDPEALAARGINLEDVRTALGQANVDLPKGTLNSPRQTYTLNTNDQLLKADDYANLVIAYRNGAPVRIRDVGVVGRAGPQVVGLVGRQARAPGGAEVGVHAAVHAEPPAVVLHQRDLGDRRAGFDEQRCRGKAKHRQERFRSARHPILLSLIFCHWPVLAERSMASRIRWFCKPSWKLGRGCFPSATARVKS